MRQARDLARADCVCHLLHHLASSNALWLRLVQDVAPHAPAREFTEPGAAKAAYAGHLQAQVCSLTLVIIRHAVGVHA